MMPESERETVDFEDWEPWDCDNGAAGEADVQDLLSEVDDET